ncbi:hypothetical protein BDY24DRAFT_388582 [Mrakia frigida]|uniref:uncharacterized protein n=1 Tax=Mrakia frigida TaxID=29902 RepID=UPI003FCC228B
MLECIGFAVGAHFVIFGFFDWDGVPVMRKVFASWIAISLAGLVFGTYQRRITWESMKLEGYERPVGLY